MIICSSSDIIAGIGSDIVQISIIIKEEIFRLKKAHMGKICSICKLDDVLFASGCNCGELKIWK
jgi:hypothetical protein